MYSVNWLLLIAQNTFIYWIKPIFITWMGVVVSPIKALHVDFLQYRLDALYKLNFNGQIIYLEHVLNDRFDNVDRGIWIDNVADLDRVYLFNKVEPQAPIYYYNNYDNGHLYSAGDYTVDDNKVYVAILDTIGHLPSTSPTKWQYDSDVIFWENKIEYEALYDFIVMVPLAVTFDVVVMSAIVNYYKCAGKRWTIQTF